MLTSRLQVHENRPGFTRAEITFPIVHRDGYEVRVWWEAEPAQSEHHPGYWCAELTGVKSSDGVLGTGDTQQAALLDLCCALGCLADALTHWGKDDA